MSVSEKGPLRDPHYIVCTSCGRSITGVDTQDARDWLAAHKKFCKVPGQVVEQDGSAVKPKAEVAPIPAPRERTRADQIIEAAVRGLVKGLVEGFTKKRH